MPISLDIAGISLAEGPVNSNKTRGRLDLPPNFPAGKYACKWVKKGVGAIKAQQPEFITVEGRNYKVDGWSVYKDTKTKAAHIRTLSDGQYVLMVRPALLQETLQKLNGNASRERMDQEIKGQTVAGKPVSDTGILPHAVLSRIPGLGAEEMTPNPVQFNSLQTTETTGTPTMRVSKLKKKH